MKARSSLLVVTLLLSGSASADPASISGAPAVTDPSPKPETADELAWRETPRPAPEGPVRPCGACTFDPTHKWLAGSLGDTDDQETFPVTELTLRLYDSSDNVLATIEDIRPDPGYVNDTVDQCVTTTVTTGVAAAKLRMRLANGNWEVRNLTLVSGASHGC